MKKWIAPACGSRGRSPSQWLIGMKKWIAQAWLFVLMGLVGECWAQPVLRVEVERGSLERRLQATPRDLRIEQIKVAGGTIRLTIETPVPSLTHRIEERELVDTGSW